MGSLGGRQIGAVKEEKTYTDTEGETVTLNFRVKSQHHILTNQTTTAEYEQTSESGQITHALGDTM